MNAAALSEPLDVRLMNFSANALLLLFVAMLLAALLVWAMRLPRFALTAITVQGEVSHHSAATLRASVLPKLSGNFITLDLAQARAVFESLPWVRKAVLRREFPNRLQVELQEHQAVAYWGAEPETRLLNAQGEVFEGHPGEAVRDDLPHLAGPQAQARPVLAMYQALQPVLQPLDLQIDQLDRLAHGGWRAQTDTGAVLELGHGELPEVTARLQRFADTLTQVAARHGRQPDALESADLRHRDGYALRLAGVTTHSTEPPAAAVKAGRSIKAIKAAKAVKPARSARPASTR